MAHKVKGCTCLSCKPRRTAPITITVPNDKPNTVRRAAEKQWPDADCISYGWSADGIKTVSRFGSKGRIITLGFIKLRGVG